MMLRGGGGESEILCVCSGGFEKSVKSREGRRIWLASPAHVIRPLL